MKVYAVEIEIQDINDNASVFKNVETTLQVLENTTPGAPFIIPQAQDADLAVNSLLRYQLNSNEYFILDVQSGDGADITMVMVLDVNDNVPVFNQPVNRIAVKENVPKGTVLSTITASDKDQGANTQITYSLSIIADIFHLNSKSVEISVFGSLIYEDSQYYEFEMQGMDSGGRSSKCKVLIDIINVNGNSPEIVIGSINNTVVESGPTGLVLAFLHMYDSDSAEYGQLSCHQ
ncbi:hypothetical protein NDU88_006457 [Pleurodeles waltl]|uniref:Cadherin domain-containing protein n=1 Tax=Pleurodeles waltl TaxID=8319 RepID=A0AAV7PIV6_PLEWA|nr:hypothetical protein NDU88_006457 [Pleurodeles waltl]